MPARTTKLWPVGEVRTCETRPTVAWTTPAKCLTGVGFHAPTSPGCPAGASARVPSSEHVDRRWLNLPAVPQKLQSSTTIRCGRPRFIRAASADIQSRFTCALQDLPSLSLGYAEIINSPNFYHIRLELLQTFQRRTGEARGGSLPSRHQQGAMPWCVVSIALHRQSANPSTS
jgi:hypothetical protein